MTTYNWDLFFGRSDGMRNEQLTSSNTSQTSDKIKKRDQEALTTIDTIIAKIMCPKSNEKVTYTECIQAKPLCKRFLDSKNILARVYAIVINTIASIKHDDNQDDVVEEYRILPYRMMIQNVYTSKT